MVDISEQLSVCFQVFYSEGHLVLEASFRDKTWASTAADVHPETWYFIELSWTLETGLKVFINQKLYHPDQNEQRQQQQLYHVTAPHRRPTRFLIGYADDVIDAKYGDFIVDELNVWFADRDTLLAFNYITRGCYFFQLYCIKERKAGPLGIGKDQNNSATV